MIVLSFWLLPHLSREFMGFVCRMVAEWPFNIYELIPIGKNKSSTNELYSLLFRWEIKKKTFSLLLFYNYAMCQKAYKELVGLHIGIIIGKKAIPWVEEADNTIWKCRALFAHSISALTYFSLSKAMSKARQTHLFCEYILLVL